MRCSKLCRTHSFMVGVSRRLRARRYPRAAMDDAARATTDVMLRDAAAATGEDNPDVNLRCECSGKTARNTRLVKL